MADQRLLIVEDDPAIGRGLRTALEGQGYEVALSTQGQDAIDLVVQHPFDLILLDLGLPDVDGVRVCHELRARGVRTTVVMLTARAEEADVVAGLDAGADDYITKPFRLAELLARVRAHLRRDAVPATAQGDRDDGGAEVVDHGRLRLDLGARRVHVDGTEIDLRPKEFDLLAMLVRHAGRALTREHIMGAVWDEHWFGSTKTLDMHVSALRRKLGEPPPIQITTLRGVGYRLEIADAPAADAPAAPEVDAVPST